MRLHVHASPGRGTSSPRQGPDPARPPAVALLATTSPGSQVISRWRNRSARLPTTRRYPPAALLAATSPGSEVTRRRRNRPARLPTTRRYPPLLLRLSALSPRARSGLHWLSAGAVGAARGLNDTPKIAAVAGFALLPAGAPVAAVVAGVAVAMAAGALLTGGRVARRLGEDVVPMDHLDGLRANLTTAALVGPGAALGLPMSTTHVSTGAIAGVAGAEAGRLNLPTLRAFLLAWTLTPAVAGLAAAATIVLAGG